MALIMANKYKVYPLTIPLIIFAGGFTNNVIPTLILYLKNTQNINTTSAILLQCLLFISYFVTLTPSTLLIQRIGYQKTLTYASLLCSIASMAIALIMYLQKTSWLYSAVFLLAFGITLLRITVTPLLVSIREAPNYHQTISRIMTADTIGALTSPTLSALWILNPIPSRWLNPWAFFIMMALGMIGICLQCKQTTLTHTNNNHISLKGIYRSLQYPNIIQGCIATFIFIGIEFSIPVFIGLLVNEQPQQSLLNPTTMISIYWTLILIGRLISVVLLRYYRPQSMIVSGSLIAMSIILLGINYLPNQLAYISVSLGLFNAYMFPCIFSIYTKRLPEKLHYYASSVFLLAFSGGAAIPFIQSHLASRIGIIHSFLLIVVCYFVLIVTIAMKRTYHAIMLEKAEV